jgi:hypothetical protein
MAMSKQTSVRFKLAAEAKEPAKAAKSGKSKPRRQSPRAGLLALVRACRGLGLPTATDEHLPVPYPLLEYQILAQASGADSVLDREILARDPCLNAGLDYPAPSDAELKGLLSDLGQGDPASTGFSKLLAATVGNAATVWTRKGNPFASSRPYEGTLDVVQMSAAGSAPTVWGKPDGELPCRVACLWHEADLVLAGGRCASHQDVIKVIQQARAALPESTFCSLLHADPVGDDPAILSWLQAQQTKTPVRQKVRRYNVPRPDSVELRYVVAIKLDPVTVRTLNEVAQGWTDCPDVAVGSLQWLDLPFEMLPPPVRELRDARIVRRRVTTPSGGLSYLYAAFRAKTQGEKHKVARWFTQGEEQMRRAAEDIALLATDPEVKDDGPTAEGRFLVALLAYNACSMIRHVWLASGPGPSLSRFRATLLCASGHISKHGTQRQLTIYNAELRKRFRMIHAAFPVSEHATLPRKPKP